MELKLRPYQQEHVDKVLNSKALTKVVQSPTGTGKSREIEYIVKELLRTGEAKKIAIITPSRELVKNIKAYFGNLATTAFTGTLPNLRSPILVTTYQSGAKYLPLYGADYYISDEAHGVNAATWSKLIPGGVRHLGYTATPNRLDGKPLGDIFEELIKSPPINWFVERGYLSEYQIIPVKTPNFKLGRGDDLGKQEEIFGTVPKIKETVKLWVDECQDRKTLIFATTISHGTALAKEFNDKGYEAEFLSSKDKLARRDEVFNRFKNGNLKVLINVELFTTGVDVPEIDTIFACRFFGSMVGAFQSFGRGTRYLPGKILKYYDLTGNAYYHGDFGLYDDWSLEGNTYKESSNQVSCYLRCYSCDKELIHKSKLRGLDEYVIDCPNCGCTNYWYKKAKKNFETKFNEIDLEKLDIDPKYGALLSHMFFISTKKISTFKKFAEIAAIPDRGDINVNRLKREFYKYLGKKIKTY